ncbi:MAG: hypothetical protein JO302_00075 [Candidatus Eremiobacteraeota bacterium]|nr:hypothetical protein [Candidatus Eremiobacteraeota bacterium]
MTRLFTALLIAAALMPAPAAAACLGSNPAITHVSVINHTTSGQVSRYHLVGTVTNEGTSGQPSNTLQFVTIWHDTDKVDSRGIPPLALGASYNFSYDWLRAPDAGAGTTKLTFRMDVRSGSNCNPANGTYSVTF